MKNKGFTLMELLGVIVILGILILISFPLILNQVKKSKQEIKNSTKELIIDAARDYFEDNMTASYKTEGITYCIEIETLENQGYLIEKIKDENFDDIREQKKVRLVYHNGVFTYDLADTCNSNMLTRNNTEVEIVTEGDGLYKSTTDQDRFIYKGSNPNNYITIKEGANYVTYRIVSFESDGTIKVVRNESIDSIAWDSRTSDSAGARKNNSNTYCDYTGTYYGCNVWANMANTYYKGELLTPDFYYDHYKNEKSIEIWHSPLVQGTVTTDSSLKTYLNGDWYTNANISPYVAEHSFNVGATAYSDVYLDKDMGIDKEKENEKLYTWTGRIALLTASEYTEASSNILCKSLWSNFSENSNNTTHPCSIDNWTFDETNQWTLTPIAENAYDVIYIKQSGDFSYSEGTYLTYGVKPAFYLRSTLTLRGTGSSTDPYRIIGES